MILWSMRIAPWYESMSSFEEAARLARICSFLASTTSCIMCTWMNALNFEHAHADEMILRILAHTFLKIHVHYCIHYIQPNSPSLEHRIKNETQLLEFFNLGLQRDLNHNSYHLIHIHTKNQHIITCDVLTLAPSWEQNTIEQKTKDKI